jgi:hypothetical protein
MRVFGIADEQHQCNGHGDYSSEEKIVRLGMYGSGDFPPLFRSWDAAVAYIQTLKYPGTKRPVELWLEDE